MEKADGLSYYRQFAVQMYKSSAEWTPDLVAAHFVIEVGMQPEKALQAATEALALLAAEKG